MSTLNLCFKRQTSWHDLRAAHDYLSLRFNDTIALRAVADLKEAKTEKRRANDILRACALEPLPLSDPGVIRGLVQLAHGKRFRPVLVASYPSGAEIADGYHRVSLAYALSPFADVRVRIVNLEGVE